MKRLLLTLAFLLAIPAIAKAQVCPATVLGITPSVTSCWPLQESTGMAITDTIDSNSGTISGAYTLGTSGGIACNNSVTGCSITTPTLYSNPQPFTLYADFAGTSGGILQLGNMSAVNAVNPFYVLFLDTHGKLTFGVDNFGATEIVQSPLPYADGNEHKAVISVGLAGMKLYVDGQLVAKRQVTLANYVNGFWFFGGINPANWQLSPALSFFNGTLYTFAWWNGSQLTDQQGVTLTGGNPNVISNSYCTFGNQIASLNPATAMAYANKKLTFTINSIQNPGGGSNLPIGPSTQVCQTDPSGNILAGCQIQQGAHVNLSVGTGPQIPLIIPFATSCDLTALMLSQTDPPEVVSAVAVAGPLFAGATVTNPPPGTIGTSTVTSPAAFNVMGSGLVTLNIGTNGNVQQVTMTGNTTVALTNFQNGANFLIDTAQDATGGRAPTFTVPAGWTLLWTGGGGQPVLPNSAANTHTIWQFVAVSSTQIAGAITSFSSNTGTFPLGGTANFNNYSGTNINGLTLNVLTPPAPSLTATCTGTCVTTYTYEIVCQGDNSTHTAPSSQQTASNAASLSASNHNLITWAPTAGCYGGYSIYGRIGGSLGLLATCLTTIGNCTATSYNDDGSAVVGAAPPSTNTTGTATVGGNSIVTGNQTIGGTLGVTGASTLTGNTTVGGTLGVTGATTLTVPLAIASGGNGTASPGLTAGPNVTLGSTWPTQSISVNNVTLRSNLQTGNPLNTVSNSTAETTLFTYSLAGNTLGTSGILACHAEGNYLNNSGSNQVPVLRFYYGSGAVLTVNMNSIAASSTPTFWNIDLRLSTIGATSTEEANAVQQTSVALVDGPSTSVLGGTNNPVYSRNSGVAVDSTVNQTVKLTVQMPSNTATQTFNIFSENCQLQ